MNMITAQVNLHLLQQESVGLGIREAMRVFRQRGLGIRECGMSTLVWGEERAVFDALGEVLHQSGELDDTVMTVTLWNGPPVTEHGRVWLAMSDAEPCQALV